MSDAIDFVKWLHAKHYVPNKSFLWFDHRLSRDVVTFHKIEDLYKAFKLEGAEPETHIAAHPEPFQLKAFSKRLAKAMDDALWEGPKKEKT